MGFIKRAWNGQEKLWKVYWLYGVLLGIVAQVIFLGLEILSAIGGFYIVACVLATLLLLAYAVWSNVALWRCAWNAKATFWGYVVRILVVISAITYAFMFKGLLMGMLMSEPAVTPSTAPVVEMSPAAAPAPVVSDAIPAAAPAVAPATPEAVQAPVAAAPAVAAPAPAAAPMDASAACTKKMTDYATQQHVDPAAYIAQNQPYLQQCIQFMTNNPSAQ